MAGVESTLQFIASQNHNNSDPIVPYQHPIGGNLKSFFAACALFICNYFEDCPKFVAFLLNTMNPQGGPNSFNDHWWRALPNDDLANIDTWVRVQFTEIWIDVNQADTVFEKLKNLFQNTPKSTGTFGTEIYTAKKSPFWMSMSYDRDVIRVDPYWFEYNSVGTLEEFFEYYWDTLLPIPTARLHWGKHFPKIGTPFGHFTIGPDYVKKSYTKFDSWMALRQKYDPEQVFVTSYWRDLLGITH